MKNRTLGRRVAAAVTGAALVAGSVISMTAPAQAYNPDPSVKSIKVNTSGCGCRLNDPFDDTYFEKDAGGTGLKMELRKDGWYVGKVEFHPADEILYFYDTRNDGDGYYGILRWFNTDNNRWVTIYFAPPSTSKVVDQDHYNLDIPEGKKVYIELYDNSSRTDFIKSATAVA
ncbi:hypothetical protein FOE78_09895 [Microlunatus elymi]|uniref:Secreted protein n=1 Tax=Microlunatus elymi TaxID=2596828 RepID=A0A516PYD2_9ACTN|nr:hypothetical protein [Microlunatus elymi]QDP96173.1 hypothetical protein FOE78_09895 [Microlunatus elymi]